jgi:hypothetical protein
LNNFLFILPLPLFPKNAILGSVDASFLSLLSNNALKASGDIPSILIGRKEESPKSSSRTTTI